MTQQEMEARIEKLEKQNEYLLMRLWLRDNSSSGSGLFPQSLSDSYWTIRNKCIESTVLKDALKELLP